LQKKKQLRIGAYVIMSNHLHTIWTAPNNNLSGMIRDFKTYTSKAITSVVENEPESRRDWLLYMFNFYANRTNANEYFKVWTGNNHPEEIRGESFLLTKLNYIHQNPVRAGLVRQPEDYIYSSASNYSSGKGLIEIDYLY
jgi:REP element-mobilizing transposase RayT